MTVGAIASSNAAQLFEAYGSSGATATKTPRDTPPSAQRRIEDWVEISERGRSVANILNSVPWEPISRQSVQEKSAAFQAELGNRFRAAGIDTSRPIDLTVDTEGQVRVANDHPDKDKIEALFAEDDDFSNQFRQLSASATILKAIEDHVEFSKAYEKDPEAALARYAHLFSGETRDFYFRYAETEIG